MTVETPPVEQPIDTKYVRKSVDGVKSLTLSTYASIKDLSPYTKQIAEAAEDRFGWVAEPLSKYYAATEPVIESLDGRVDNIITAASTLKTKAVTTVDTVKTTAVTTVDSVKSKAITTVDSVKSKAVITVDSVKSEAAKKSQQAYESFSQVKEFSATRGKEMIHVDLIAYAEEVLDNANNIAKPTYLAIQKKLAVAITNVNTSVHQLQEAVVDRVNRAELQEKMEIAIERVRELAKYGSSYVNSNVEVLRVFAKEQQSLIHTNLEKSIDYILSAPELFHGYNQIVFEKSGVDIEKHASTLKSRAEDLIKEANILLAQISQVIRGVSATKAEPKAKEPVEEKEPIEEIDA